MKKTLVSGAGEVSAPDPHDADEIYRVVQCRVGYDGLPGNAGLLERRPDEHLRATRDGLQDSVDRQEVSDEDLAVSSEQVISINEGFQYANGELECSAEALRSLNEELTTTNRQLLMKVADLESRFSELSNLLSSSQIATLCLDRELRVRWFSPGMNDVGKIVADHVGRPITDVSCAGLGDGLVEDAKGVLEHMVPQQRELLSEEGCWHLRRVMPYRGDNDQVCGVVVTYMDITEAKQTAEAAVKAHRAMAASLEERVRARTTQLRALTAELALTEERERRVLARDLHDDLGQLLAVAKIKLTSLEESERRGVLKSSLKEIETLIDRANRSVRSLMLQLHPPALQALNFVEALEWLGEEMDRLYGLAVYVDKDGDLPAIEEPARTTVFRVVRELLINVAKHAKTNTAQINVQKGPDGGVLISVTDEGEGFEYEKAVSNPAIDSGFGLLSIRERIEFIGGEINVDSTPGYGTTATIGFPVPNHHPMDGEQR